MLSNAPWVCLPDGDVVSCRSAFVSNCSGSVSSGFSRCGEVRGRDVFDRADNELVSH